MGIELQMPPETITHSRLFEVMEDLLLAVGGYQFNKPKEPLTLDAVIANWRDFLGRFTGHELEQAWAFARRLGLIETDTAP
jgi:hypothetical protein